MYFVLVHYYYPEIQHVWLIFLSKSHCRKEIIWWQHEFLACRNAWIQTTRLFSRYSFRARKNFTRLLTPFFFILWEEFFLLYNLCRTCKSRGIPVFMQIKTKLSRHFFSCLPFKIAEDDKSLTPKVHFN